MAEHDGNRKLLVPFTSPWPLNTVTTTLSVCVCVCVCVCGWVVSFFWGGRNLFVKQLIKFCYYAVKVIFTLCLSYFMLLFVRFWAHSFWSWLSEEATWIIPADMVLQQYHLTAHLWELLRTQHRVVMVAVTAEDPLIREGVTLRAAMEVTMSR